MTTNVSVGIIAPLKTTSITTLFGFVFWLLAMPVAAEQVIEEIVVTAARRAVTADALSQASTIVVPGDSGAEALLTETLRNEVGVFLQQTTPGQGAPIIRGLRGSAVLHLVDGMRLNNAIFRSAPTQYLALVPVSATDRIEVLRGGSASLYGTDAVAGVVNVVTKMPRLVDRGSGTGGFVDLRLDAGSQTRVVMAGLEHGTARLAARFSAEYHDIGDRRIGGGERLTPSDYRAIGMSGAVAGRLANQWRWSFGAQFMDQPSTPRVDELVAGFEQTTASSSEFFFAPNRRS
ncbi:MAG: TonB-dependent receptor plug domain-containing protein, partial [Pseudomonadota bacterium]